MAKSILPDFSRPLVFAHRGISAVAPENTMASFKLAREKGIPGIELDIHLTADGMVPVFYDHDTGRVGGAPGIAPGLEAKGKGLSLEKVHLGGAARGRHRLVERASIQGRANDPSLRALRGIRRRFLLRHRAEVYDKRRLRPRGPPPSRSSRKPTAGAASAITCSSPPSIRSLSPALKSSCPRCRPPSSGARTTASPPFSATERAAG